MTFILSQSPLRRRKERKSIVVVRRLFQFVRPLIRRPDNLRPQSQNTMLAHNFSCGGRMKDNYQAAHMVTTVKTVG